MLFGAVSAVAVLVHGYLWLRLVRDTTRPGRWRRIGTTVMVLLAVLLVSALVVSRLWSPQAAAVVAWPGYIWLALLMYLVLLLLVAELPKWFIRRGSRRVPVAAAAAGSAPLERDPVPVDPPAEPVGLDPVDPEPVDLGRRLVVARGFAVAAGVASAGIVGTGMVSALGRPDLLRVPIGLRGLHADLVGFRIAVVSDIHLGPILGRRHCERVVRMINETRPDLVAIVGDTVDGSVDDLRHSVEPLRDLVSAEGAFMVTGNHEYYSGVLPWLTEFERLGIDTLRNERTTITRGAGRFDLAGINDVNGRGYEDGPDLDRALAGRDTSAPVVLLAHQPVQVRDAAKADVDLQLSGHTHGGQLYPFHHVVALAQPAVAGLSKVDNTWLYVTRGAGFWGTPVRVGAPPDITVVELGPV